MNVIFLPEPMTTSLVSMTSSKLEILDEEYQPMDAVNNFHSFFSGFDRGASADDIKLRIDISKARKAFWDRADFLAVLRRICLDDVYVQANSYYSINLGFLNPNDKIVVEKYLENPLLGQPHIFSATLTPEIKEWLKEEGAEHRITEDGSFVTVLVRDPVMANLLAVKFNHTKAGDHSKEKIEVENYSS